MTLVTYSNGPRPSTTPVHRRRHKTTGTAHIGPDWVSVVRILRLVIRSAVTQAPWGRSTADVGAEIAERAHELGSKSLHVLAVVFGILTRSKRNQ